MANNRNQHTLAVLVAFAVLCYWTEGCDDVSRQACHDLMSSNSDLCNDACLSSVCARTCGKCTLKCYSCHEVNRPEDCNTTLECPSSDYQCISVKSFTGQFQEVYKLGCAPGNVCDNADLETSCCTDDLCNNHKPLPPTTTTTTTTTVTAKITTPTSKTSDTTTGGSGVLLIGRRENSDPFCSESAPAVCQELLRSDTNVCSKECIKSMCPVSCGKCKLCYNCPYVADSDLCNATSLCSHDELCYGLETVNSYQEHGFRLGCAPQPVCDSIATISTNTFGNRATRTLVGGCCHDNLCNTHIKKISTTTTSTTTTTTTTTPTTTHNYCHCPSDGHTYHGHCFFVSPDSYTHNDAKTFCQSRCASLAHFSSESELEKIVNEIRSSSLHQSGRRFILDTISSNQYLSRTALHIDAVYDTRRHWVWESTMSRIPHDITRNATNPNHYSCGAVRSWLWRPHLVGVTCSTLHNALCLLH